MDNLELKLPPSLEDALRSRATAHARSLEEEARALLEAALRDPLADNQLEQLAVLDDEQLWEIARQQVSADKSERMQALTESLQTEGLSGEEGEELGRLQAYGERVMLLRAEAAVLLKRRGYDVSGLRVQV